MNFHFNLKKIFFCVIISIIISFNINAKDNLTAFIPSNADIVVSLNAKNLYQKSLIDNNEFYKELFKNLAKDASDPNDAKIYEYLKDMSSMGIDKNSNYHIYFSNISGGDYSFGVIIPLTDKEKFKNFVLTAEPSGDPSKIKSINDYYYFLSGGLIAWNDKTLILIIDNAVKNEADYLTKYDYVFKGFVKEPLINNADFKNFQSEEWDASTWINVGALMESYITNSFNYLDDANAELEASVNNKKLYEDYEKKAKRQSKKNRVYDSPLTGKEYAEQEDYENAAKWHKDEYDTNINMYDYYKGLHEQYSKINSEAVKNYKGMYYTAKLVFLNGKITLSNKITAGGNIKLPVSEKIGFSKETLDMIAKNFIFCMSGNLDLKNIYTELKKLQFGDIAQSTEKFESVFKDSPITMNEIFELFSQDFSFSITDYVNDTKTLNFIYALKIKNRVLLGKFIDYQLKLQSIQEQSVGNVKVYSFTSISNPQVYLVIKDDIFYITVNDIKDMLVADKANSIPVNKNMIEMQNKNSMIGYLNYYNFVKQIFGGNNSLTGSSEEYAEIIQIFEEKVSNVKAELTIPNQRQVNLNITIDLINTNENSLKLLVDWIMAYALVKMK